LGQIQNKKSFWGNVLKSSELSGSKSFNCMGLILKKTIMKWFMIDPKSMYFSVIIGFQR